MFFLISIFLAFGLSDYKDFRKFRFSKRYIFFFGIAKDKFLQPVLKFKKMS